MSTQLSSTSMHFMALPVPVLEPMAALPTFGDHTFFIMALVVGNFYFLLKCRSISHWICYSHCDQNIHNKIDNKFKT